MNTIKYIILFVVAVVFADALSAQETYVIKADSVKLTGCDSSELIIENHTQNVPGFLYNTGKGRTIFKRGLVKVNDSIYLIGGDTLKGNPWLQGGNRFGAVGKLGTLDSNHLDIYTNNVQRARWNAAGNLLIGTLTDNGNKLQLSGSSYFNGAQQITGTSGGINNSKHIYINPTVDGGTGVGNYFYGELMNPVMNTLANYQQGYGLAIVPTYNLNGFTQHPDAISAALYVKSPLGGIWIAQSTSYTGTTGQPLYIYQDGSANKELIRTTRNGNLSSLPFIWNHDNRPVGGKGFMVPAIRSSIASPTAGGGVSFTMDRYYSPMGEAAIEFKYETTPIQDTASTVNTSIALNTTDQGVKVTPLYLNGSKVGVGIKTPSAQLHTTGTVRFAGLTNDSTQTRVLVSDANGNIYYRSAASLAANDMLHSSLAVNGPIRARSLTLSQSGWPDYVFDSAYHLLSLTEVEKYVRENNHLPGVPSAGVVEKEGVSVGEVQAVLLKKIEELTLYNIAQGKALQELRQEVRELRKKIDKKHPNKKRYL